MSTAANNIIQLATQEYLNTLDLADLPEPSQIENNLLDITNAAIAAENTNRKNADKLRPLKALTFGQVAMIIMKLHNVCKIAPHDKNTDPDYDLLAIYVDEGEEYGIYNASEEAIRKVARRYNFGMTNNEFKELLTILRDIAPRKYRCQDRDIIPVRNGLFNYRTKTLHEFSPETIVLSKARVDYVPDPISPVIHNDKDGTDWEVEEWMSELSDDPDVVELLWQIIGAIIRPMVRWNKAAFFYSDRGNNGKGTLCELMRSICGPQSYAAIPLADFGKDFLLEPLVRASAIIVDENDVGTFIDKAANLKAVITQDVISINRKFKTPISYQFCGFMVQCLNDYPRIKDKSESFYRRQLFIPFTKNFTGIERTYIKDDYLHRDDVLQYVLHRVLHMNYYALSEPESIKYALDQFKENNDPVRAFWYEFRDVLAWDLLPFSFLYDLYLAWTKKTNPSSKIIGRNTFINDITSIVHNDPDWYTTGNRNKVRHKGILMAEPEPLIVEYKLEDWYHPGYPGSNVKHKASPQLRDSYRGILRNATAGLEDDENPDPKETT